MGVLNDYAGEEVATPDEWHDVLARRMMPQTKRLHTLSISNDGRVATGLSSVVSVLNPSLIVRATKSVMPQGSPPVGQTPEKLILSNDLLIARDIRPPTLGNEIAFESRDDAYPGHRSDTVMGWSDIACVSWARSSAGSVLFVANGGGSCFAMVPRYPQQDGKQDGTWGGLWGRWRFQRISGASAGSAQVVRNGRTQPRDGQSSVPRDGWRGTAGSTLLAAPHQVHPPLPNGNSTGHSSTGPSAVGNRLVPSTGLRIERQVRCLACCKVFKNNRSNPALDCDSRHYLLVGTREGTFLNDFSGIEDVNTLSERPLQLHSTWSASLCCLEDVPFSNRAMTLVAVGGPSGDLTCYGIWLEQEDSSTFILMSRCLWRSQPSLLFGPVTSVVWGGEHSDQGRVKLAVSAGNTIAVLSWSINSETTADFRIWQTPCVHRVRDAHVQMVSSVQIVADGSLLSSSLDGTVCLWMIDEWDDGEDESGKVFFFRVHDALKRLEPVMGMEKTVCGLGVLVLTTANQGYTEVRIVNEDPKYAAASRRSLLSLLMIPFKRDGKKMVDCILSVIDKLANTRRYVGEAIAMWDIELCMHQVDVEESGVLQALRQKFYEMMEALTQKRNPEQPKHAYEHFARVTLCLSQLILRAGGTDIPAIERMERARKEMVAVVWCSHYDQCLQSFLDGAFDVQSASIDECRALDSMCQFTLACKPKMMWDGQATMERVRRVREALEPRLSQGQCGLPCPLCEPDMSIPLVCDAADPCSFYCSEGDVFTRCVVTALPVVDAVPLVCYCCEARAQERHFDPHGGNRQGEFGWIGMSGQCPQCMSPLLPSSVEMQ